MSSFKLFLILSILNIIHLQSYSNPIRYLTCGIGIDSTPNLLEYPKKIEKEENFSPIRIFIDFTNFELDIAEYSNIAKSKSLIKEKLLKATKLMEEIINVQRFTEKVFFSEDLLNKISFSIPHFDSKLKKGISYDLVVVPKIKNLKKVNLESEVKYVNFKGYPLVIEPTLKRPIVGIIEIFDLDYSNMDNSETYFVNSFIHQLMHIMVFDTKLIKNFPNYDKNNPPYNQHFDYTTYNLRNFITTPKVSSFAKRHFNNPNMNGLQLEYNTFIDLNDNMYHWDGRFMTGDIMIADFYEEQTISEITLALFEDSNWYKVNYYTGGLFRFGKNETFIFTDLYCINNYGFDNTLKNIFCTEEKEKRCTGGRLNKGYCKFYSNEMIPSYFQYFKYNTTKGGRKNIDFCPITQKEDETGGQLFNFYPGNCKNGLYFRKNLAEEFSDHSFCAISNVVPKNKNLEKYLERRAVCYQMHCTDTTLTIQIGNFYLTCPKQGGVFDMPSEADYMGTIECPDYNLICTGSVVCNNIEDCIEKKSIYKESSFVYEGKTYAFQSLNKINYQDIKNIGEESDNGKCGKNCLYCNEGNSCLKCRDGLYAIGSKKNKKGDTTELYCDLKEKFTKDNYEYYNNIYYPKN